MAAFYSERVAEIVSVGTYMADDDELCTCRFGDLEDAVRRSRGDRHLDCLKQLRDELPMLCQSFGTCCRGRILQELSDLRAEIWMRIPEFFCLGQLGH